MPRGEVLTLNSNKIVDDTRIYSKCDQNTVPCWVLVIEMLREDDTGYYVCQTNAMQTKYIYLDVLGMDKCELFFEVCFFLNIHSKVDLCSSAASTVDFSNDG